MDIKHARTLVFIDGVNVSARGASSGIQMPALMTYQTLESKPQRGTVFMSFDADNIPTEGRHTVRVEYPGGLTTEYVCDVTDRDEWGDLVDPRFFLVEDPVV